MTRRDGAVLLFVGLGLYCLVISLSYLSSLIQLFAPMTPLPPDWNPAIYFASYLIPFGVLLAAGQLLIRGRHALADQLFGDDAPAHALATEQQRAAIAGSLIFTMLGLLAFFIAIERLPAVVQMLQPHNWRSVSATRAVLLAVFHPLLLLAYVLLGWYALTRRDFLTRRWITATTPASDPSDPAGMRLETMVRRAVALWFMFLALVPVGHALVGLLARGFSSEPLNSWDLRSATVGALQLLFGLVLYAGRDGLRRALHGLMQLRPS
jgi:hypothetical protein